MSVDFEPNESFEAEAVYLRRELHKIPEAAYREFKTHEFVYNYIEGLKPDELFSPIETGVKAVFYSRSSNAETVALRADMDALYTVENTGLPFASEHPGLMHACGHDAHMAIMLVMAKIVSQNRHRLNRNIVFLFQPAEEGEGGAHKMVVAGALDCPHVDRIYGYHVLPNLPVGKIGVAACAPGNFGFDITIRGESAHGALPHLGRDAIVAAAAMVTSLQTVVSRSMPPNETIVLTVGEIHGGKKRNILCDEVTLSCSLRTFSEDIRLRTMKAVENIVRGIDEMFSTKSSIVEHQNYPPLVNSKNLAERFLAESKRAVAIPPLLFSEDFSYYCAETEGLLLLLGVGDKPSLHNDKFSIDEAALKYGISELCALVFDEEII